MFFIYLLSSNEKPRTNYQKSKKNGKNSEWISIPFWWIWKSSIKIDNVNITNILVFESKVKMNYKKIILEKICYTELVYERINKKLHVNLSKSDIEKMIFKIIKETDESNFKKKGKNIYIANDERNIILTINAYTNRIITAGIINKKNYEPLT